MFLFFFLYLTLLIGFYFNEDASGSGGFRADFYNTWGYVIALQDKIFEFPGQWTDNTPLHYLIISKLNLLLDDKFYLRLFFCIFSFLVPYIFFKCLEVKFPKINKNYLIVLASSIFLFPAFRSGAIWANNHITAFIFFLLYLFFYVKWEKNKKFNKFVFYQCTFLALAVYTRQYYALFFFYSLYVYFFNLNFKKFIFICIYIAILAIPGLFLIYYDNRLLTPNVSNNLSNLILISSSIISFYFFPFYLFLILKKNYKVFNFKKIFIFISIIIFVSILYNYFNYNYKIGGGFFIKLSYLIFDNNYFFLATSIFGLFFSILLLLENKNNTLLILILLIGFPSNYIFQKYYEPMLLFSFFLLFRSNLINIFFTNKKYQAIYYLYILLYLVCAIINDQLNLTKTLI